MGDSDGSSNAAQSALQNTGDEETGERSGFFGRIMEALTPVEQGHVVPAIQGSLDHVPTEEAGTAEDEDLHGVLAASEGGRNARLPMTDGPFSTVLVRMLNRAGRENGLSGTAFRAGSSPRGPGRARVRSDAV